MGITLIRKKRLKTDRVVKMSDLLFFCGAVVVDLNLNRHFLSESGEWMAGVGE